MKTTANPAFSSVHAFQEQTFCRNRSSTESLEKTLFFNREITTGDLCAGFLCIRGRVAGFVREFTVTDQRERIPLVAVYGRERRKKMILRTTVAAKRETETILSRWHAILEAKSFVQRLTRSRACTVFAIRTIACNTCNRDDGWKHCNVYVCLKGMFNPLTADRGFILTDAKWKQRVSLSTNSLQVEQWIIEY